MAILHVLRPIASWGAFEWVHAEDPSHPGRPLCGNDQGFQLSQEEVLDSEDIQWCPKCIHAQQGFQVETHQSGQIRAYGASEYIYTVTDLGPIFREKEEVLAFCQAHVKKSYRKSEMPSWSHPQLMGFSSASPGKWRYHVRMEYTG